MKLLSNFALLASCLNTALADSDATCHDVSGNVIENTGNHGHIRGRNLHGSDGHGHVDALKRGRCLNWQPIGDSTWTASDDGTELLYFSDGSITAHLNLKDVTNSSASSANSAAGVDLNAHVMTGTTCSSYGSIYTDSVSSRDIHFLDNVSAAFKYEAMTCTPQPDFQLTKSTIVIRSRGEYAPGHDLCCEFTWFDIPGSNGAGAGTGDEPGPPVENTTLSYKTIMTVLFAVVMVSFITGVVILETQGNKR